MKNLTNINWESERQFDNIQEATDMYYSETDWNLTFEFEGEKLFSIVDFDVNLYQQGDEETNSICLDVLDTNIIIKQILDENDEEFKMSLSQSIELVYFLQSDLKTEF
jgi:hypothetical protein